MKYTRENFDKLYENLNWLMDNHNDDNLTISSTGMDYIFTENILIDRLLEIQTLINEIKK